MKLKQKLDKYFEWVKDLYFIKEDSKAFTDLLLLDLIINFIPLVFCFSIILLPFYYSVNLYWKLTESKRIAKQFAKDNETIKEKIQQYGKELISVKGLLKLDDKKDKKYEYDLSEFIYTLLVDFNNKYNTIYLDRHMAGSIQCVHSKRRSLGDIFRICKYYHPECTIEEVLQILIKLCIDKRISGSRCGQIHKYVFYVREGDVFANSFSNETLEYLPNSFSFKRVIQAYKPDYKFT
jgi:hypothetical protein